MPRKKPVQTDEERTAMKIMRDVDELHTYLLDHKNIKYRAVTMRLTMIRRNIEESLTESYISGYKACIRETQWKPKKSDKKQS